MEFTGRVFFDVSGADTWNFYKMIAAGVQAGATVRIDWQPVARDDTSEAERRAMTAFAWAKREHADRHGIFLQALLIVVHEDRLDLAAPTTLAQAAEAAGIDARAMANALEAGGGEADVAAAATEAGRLGVGPLPAVYRHGPVLHVKVNGAAVHGDVLHRLDTIDRMLDDDGLWELRKP
jgi:predicted DsbA family dithiol-disulfide isomerase